MQSKFGGKADNLIKLKKDFGKYIPDFFAVDTKSDLESQFLEATKIFRENELVAFRSSMNIEDGKEFSFAGMFDSFLNKKFTRENYHKFIKACVKSGKSKRVKNYMKINNIDSKVESFVIIQRMFKGEYFGVAFPSENKDEWILNYSKTAESAVRGDDSKEIILSSGIVTFSENVDTKIWKKLLTILNKLHKFFGFDIDVEWAVSNDAIAILQVRSVTKSILNNEDTIIWDNSNIAENYPSTTSPLTYSFIRESYSQVYKSFLGEVGVSSKKLINQQQMLDNMLGYINGHIYYNIQNWYEMLRLLPFFRINKGFFENMLKPAKKFDSNASKLGTDIFGMTKFVYKLMFPKRSFYKFDENYSKLFALYNSFDKKKMKLTDILDNFDQIQKKFFDIWAYTIINDFRVMISFGILTKLSKKWIQKSDEYLSSLFDDKLYPFSYEPIKKLYEMAMMVEIDSDLKSIFEKSDNEILKQIKSHELFYNYFEDYIQQFGDRSANELKLEQKKLREKPEELVGLIKNYMNYEKPQFIKKITVPMKIGIIKKVVISFLSKITLSAIYKREEFRLKRGKVFGLAREVFLEIADRFVKTEILEEREDIFYLNKEEIWNIVRFHSLPNESFKQIVSDRKKRLEKYKEMEMPTRIITHGFNTDEIKFIDDTLEKNADFVGQVTSHSSNDFVEETAVVMTEFDPEVDVKGKILVTRKTDPGWTVIFPMLKGIILEKGNLLSHASIIARELDIPCIVGIKDATKKIKNGDKVKIDIINNQVIILNGHNKKTQTS